MNILVTVVSRFLPPSCREVNSLKDLEVIFFDLVCLKDTITRFLAFCVVAFAGVIKLPQIWSIIRASSAQGISTAALCIETFGYVYNLAYHRREGYPLSSYGDFSLLALQNLFILFLSYRYRHLDIQAIGIVVFFIALIFFMTSLWMPLHLLRLLVTCNILTAMASRIPQIYNIFKNKSGGTLSLITCLGIFGGACTRIWTTAQDVKDNLVLFGYVVSTLLNGILCLQLIYYRYFKSKKNKEE
ncbi:Mannose-P-dolichol utilization defect 1 protein [Galdieria sulphuraria]|uniref:Mannose-P-dolichol utilization defect 1 protein homolog n=1 Tax=Galdieria sulphuraria TaxID=130081 RepID=M2W618_GALSU|nr:lysosomal cysteine transporter, LCT family [Galdieria sulphuraria]EME31211.1 lysosomal cysteine transporter, LCT family [Galdieria sulphuraria]GJD07621.1 Mannose-P-dolichol utilization defect 1 protein [Galdieria sulphuraria]|eukprot:XP_005707731.1 lysosomal cysteine transporter, LCT family [Galdieria sulphuraria]